MRFVVVLGDSEGVRMQQRLSLEAEGRERRAPYDFEELTEYVHIDDGARPRRSNRHRHVVLHLLSRCSLAGSAPERFILRPRVFSSVREGGAVGSGGEMAAEWCAAAWDARLGQ